jgi:hypothetical protein
VDIWTRTHLRLSRGHITALYKSLFIRKLTERRSKLIISKYERSMKVDQELTINCSLLYILPAVSTVEGFNTMGS